MRSVLVDGVTCWRYLERLDRESCMVVVTLVPVPGQPNEYAASRHVVGRGVQRDQNRVVLSPTRAEHVAELNRARGAFDDEEATPTTMQLRVQQAQARSLVAPVLRDE